jgi:hypothetical protein
VGFLLERSGALMGLLNAFIWGGGGFYSRLGTHFSFCLEASCQMGIVVWVDDSSCAELSAAAQVSKLGRGGGRGGEGEEGMERCVV